MSLQNEFLKDIEKESNKLNVISKYITMIKDDDIDNAKDNLEDKLNINHNTINIYVEYATRKLIHEHKFYNDKLTAYIILFHPKLFDLVCLDHTPKEVNEIKVNLLNKLNEIYENKQKDEKYDNIIKSLTYKDERDEKTMNVIEYCYYLTWATYEKEWTDISKDVVIKNNNNDILCINLTYNLQNLDSIVIYNNVPNIRTPILTKKMVEQTKRYQTLTPTKIAKEPLTLYDKNFNKIQKLNTPFITILLDYGNGYYTKCSLKHGDTTNEFANEIINRKVKCNVDKNLFTDIANKDIFNYLPQSCYQEKKDKNKLLEIYNNMKRMAINDYSDKPKLCINNILNDPLLKTTINEHELPIFKVYLNYLLTAEDYSQTMLENHLCNYIYEGLFESKTLMDTTM